MRRLQPKWTVFALTAVLTATTTYAQTQGRQLSDVVREDVEAREAAQKDMLAESIVARREAVMGRHLDGAYRAVLKAELATYPLARLEQLEDAGGAAVLRDSGPSLLGDTAADLVYTPVTPCRVFDTRLPSPKPIAAGTQRNFDVAGSIDLSGQGGSPTGCGIPFGPATAVMINFAAVNPAGAGNLRAWAVASPQPAAPVAAVMNYAPAMAALANGIAVPICNPAATSCSAGDLRLQADVSSVHVVGDVVGYFAAPVATALDCITVSSAVTAVPVNSWTAVDANCSAGRTATGGGYDTTEGTLGYPGVWLTTLPNGNGWRTWVDNQASGPRNIQTFVRCCRVPGR